MALATIPGYPRIGKRRELKRPGRLLVRQTHRRRAAGDGVCHPPRQLEAQTAAGSNSSRSTTSPSMTRCSIPARWSAPCHLASAGQGDTVDLDLLAMARRCRRRAGAGMELTKWFDTNYHYLVPDFRRPDLPPRQ